MWIFDKFLHQLVRHGQLRLVYPDGVTKLFGREEEGWPSVTLILKDKKVPADILRDRSLGLAEAWMDGRIEIEGTDIMGFVTFMRANTPWETKKPRKPKGYAKRLLGRTKRHVLRANDRRRARNNVAHHYDLSEQLYALFLDEDRQYSCAYWPDVANSPNISLEQAQTDKKAHIAAKLALAPGQKVLDIGCGWGGMALYLHRTFGVEVLGVTLSEEQLKVARRRAEEAGVADHVRFELIDYRDLDEKLGAPFDRIVSVGMFEHVGARHYQEFFVKCHQLLKPDGVMLLHTIGRVGGPGTTDNFTNSYIFPGGYIPALSEVVKASEQARLMATDVEVLRLHYALTLRQWYERTVAHRAEIEALYDERFFRMWTFYLAGATASFESGGMVNFQIQYARNRRTLPITRDYMAEAETAIKAR